MAAPDLSLVVPVYNEELVLEHSLAQLRAFAEQLGRSFEIVCVDDGSHDRSAAILAAAAAADPRVRVETHAKNRGKGAAVRTGVLAARGAAVLFLDADLSTPLEQTQAFLDALAAGNDVVLGNRRSAGAQITRHQPWLRERMGRCFTLLTAALLAPGIHDFTCGFKAFRAEAARAIFSRSTLDGWAFDAELVVIAREQKLRIAQVPVRWRHEDDSKVRVFRAALASLRELALIWWKRLRGRYR